MTSVMLLLLAQPSPAEDQAWERLKARIESAPQEIATFVERRAGCNHFDGEVGSEYPERERQVQQARQELRCNNIESDTRAIQRKYKNTPDVLKLLDDTEHLRPW